MTFANPWAFALAAGWLVVMAALEVWDRRRRRALLARLGDPELVARLAASASPGRRLLKRVLLALAGAALAVALARPQRVGTTEVALRGLDLVVALDVSTSMLVTDVTPTPAMRERGLEASRLELGRELVANVLAELPEDRIGPVVFAGAAAHFPLTADREVALQFLRDIGPADLPRGSDLASALRVARCLLHRELFAQLGCTDVVGRHGDGGKPRDEDRRDGTAKKRSEAAELEEHEERGRAVLLVTDGGEDSAAARRELAALPADARVPLIVVAVGSTAGGQVYDIDDDGRRIGVKRDADGQPVISRRADQPLRELVASAGLGSRLLVAPPSASAVEVLASLRELGRGLTTKKAKKRQDVYHPLVLAAILLLLVDTAVATRRRRPQAP